MEDRDNIEEKDLNNNKNENERLKIIDYEGQG